MVHHLVTEKDITEQCIYCGNSLHNKDWVSEFHVEKHYKSVICSCGSKNHVTVNFFGSGHDDWNKNTNRKESIEDKLKK